MDWVKRLIADKDGNPSEHIIAACLGMVGLWGLTAMLVYLNHPPSLFEFGGAHGTIWAAGGAGQYFSSRGS